MKARYFLCTLSQQTKSSLKHARGAPRLKNHRQQEKYTALKLEYDTNITIGNSRTWQSVIQNTVDPDFKNYNPTNVAKALKTMTQWL